MNVHNTPIKNKGLKAFDETMDTQIKPININLPKNNFEEGIVNAYNDCSNLLLYRRQDNIRQDPRGSIEYYSRICKLNDVYRCMKFGQMYREGKGVPQDYLNIKKYYSKACDLNYAQGCVNLGVLYREGRGVKQDYSKAMKYFDKSCTLHYSPGCQ